MVLRDWSEHMGRAEGEQHPVSVQQCLCAHSRRAKILEMRDLSLNPRLCGGGHVSIDRKYNEVMVTYFCRYHSSLNCGHLGYNL